MKKIIILLGAFVLCQTAAFGQSDVFIDLNGNMETGVTNPSGRLEVQGDTDRDAVSGITDGTGKGVYGENTDSNGYAGYFLGNAHVTGDLTVDGLLIGDSWTGTGDIYTTLGNVGIGTTSPELKLSLSGDGGILAKGTWLSGSDLTTTGAGTRMIWYPKKAAFRVGGVSGSQWDNTNIGDYSVAMGDTTKASGSRSMAVGLSTTASAQASTAMGQYTTASGQYSTATGFGTTASGVSSTALGNGTTASGWSSTALGDGTTALAYASTVLGRYNIVFGNSGTWISTDPLFVIGNGSSGASRSNAVTVLKNGKTGIGTESPSEKLSVAGTIESTSGGMKFPDGTVQSSARYGGVAVVAASGGDYTDPLTAMGDISTWCGTPSAANPCMLKLMPGIYDLGNNRLAMQSYVDIEGSGENTTTITSTHSSATISASSATLSGANNAEIRFLTIENQGGSSVSIVIFNEGVSPDITYVTATASGGSSNYGVENRSGSSSVMTNVICNASGGISNIGVANNGWSSTVMTNVTTTASGGTNNRGVSNYSGSSPVMTNVTATAYGGTNNYGIDSNNSSPTIISSRISGTSNSIFNSSSTVKVSATMLDGPVSGAGFSCVGAYDENFLALNSSCN